MTDQPAPGLARNLWALGPVVIALFSIVPVWWPGTLPEGTQIVQPRGVVLWTAAIAAVWFFALLVISERTKGRRGPAPLAFLIALFVLLGIAFLWTTTIFVGWRISAAVTAPSGAEFAGLHRQFAGAEVVVARKTAEWGVAARYQTLAGGWSDHGARLIRPAGLTARGLVVRIGCVAWIDEYSCRCAATDDGTRLLYASQDEDDRLVVVQSGSPFFLIGPGETVEPSDIDRIERAIAGDIDEFERYDEDWPEPPTDDGLAEALRSENASIRAAAARLVRAGGSMLYPQASRRLR